jgi:hypothetical protein
VRERAKPCFSSFRANASLGWKTERHLSAFARRAVKRQRPAVQFDYRFHQRYPEAGSFMFPGQRAVDLPEWRHDLLHVPFGDTDTTVGDRDGDTANILKSGGNTDRAIRWREFRGIGQKIEQHLFERPFVGEQARHDTRQTRHDMQILLVRLALMILETANTTSFYGDVFFAEADLPAPTLDRSRMSLMISSRCEPLP